MRIRSEQVASIPQIRTSILNRWHTLGHPTFPHLSFLDQHSVDLLYRILLSRR